MKRQKTGRVQPPLPPRHGPWRAEAKRTWESWFKSPVARRWSPAQVVAAGRLLALVHDLAATEDGGERIRLSKEVRIQEGHLGLGRRPSVRPKPTSKLTEAERLEASSQWQRESNRRHRAEREAARLTQDEQAQRELDVLYEGTTG